MALTLEELTRKQLERRSDDLRSDDLYSSRDRHSDGAAFASILLVLTGLLSGWALFVLGDLWLTAIFAVGALLLNMLSSDSTQSSPNSSASTQAASPVSV